MRANSTSSIPAHSSRLFEPSERPPKPAECNDLFSFLGAQHIAHTDGAYSVAVNVPGLIVGRI